MENLCHITVDSSRLFPLGDAVKSYGVPEDLEEQMPENDDFFDDFAEDADAFYSPIAREKEALLSPPVCDAWEKTGEDVPKARAMNTSFQTLGTVVEKEDGALVISYDDTDLTGLEGCRTTFHLTPEGRLILLRTGPGATCLVFEEGKRQLCDYGKLLGLPSLVLHTHTLNTTKTKGGGNIRVDYTVEIGGTKSEENHLILRYQR